MFSTAWEEIRNEKPIRYKKTWIWTLLCENEKLYSLSDNLNIGCALYDFIVYTTTRHVTTLDIEVTLISWILFEFYAFTW